MKVRMPGHTEMGGHRCPHSRFCTRKLRRYLEWPSIANWDSGYALEAKGSPNGTEAECKHGTRWVVVRSEWRRVEDDPNPPAPSSDDWLADPSIEQLQKIAERELRGS